MRPSLCSTALVFMGGCAGTGLRVGVGVVAGSLLGTFLVNIIGSFALGAITAMVLARSSAHIEQIRLLFGVGFCGAFTTYSALVAPAVVMISTGSVFLAGVDLLGSIIAGLLAGLLGFRAGECAWG